MIVRFHMDLYQFVIIFRIMTVTVDWNNFGDASLIPIALCLSCVMINLIVKSWVIPWYIISLHGLFGSSNLQLKYGSKKLPVYYAWVQKVYKSIIVQVEVFYTRVWPYLDIHKKRSTTYYVNTSPWCLSITGMSSKLIERLMIMTVHTL